MSIIRKKVQLREMWEECFGKKIGDALTPNQMAKFWDSKTTLDEAQAILDEAAIKETIGQEGLEFFEEQFKEFLDAVLRSEPRRKEGPKPVEFKVLQQINDGIYADTGKSFTSKDEAYDWINNSVSVERAKLMIVVGVFDE